MKTAVIICGGEGTRCGGQPKALRIINGKTLIHRSMIRWRPFVDRFIFVLNAHADAVTEEICRWAFDEDIIACELSPPMGLASALVTAEKHLCGSENTFHCILGDQLFDTFLAHGAVPDDACRLGVVTNGPESANYSVYIDVTGQVERVVEKPEGTSGLCGIGYYVFDRRIFHYCRMVNLSSRGLYEITDAIQLAIDGGVPFWPAYHDGRWIHITTESDVQAADQWFKAVEI